MKYAALSCMTALALAGCGEADPKPTAPAPAYGADLPVGEYVETEEGKADGWGHALTCKDIPDLPALEAPRLVLSIDGHTVHLIDEATGFDKVFPTGVGALDRDEGSPTYGESFSAFPLIATRGHDFEITPNTIQPCKTWLGNSGVPVFAGLPFLSFYGNYGLHGPIDNYRRADGGTLRRGYVSHGCFRMRGADIAELYARIRGVAHVPVRLQRAPERREDGRLVDVPDNWMGAECATDADCGFEDGTCRLNPFSGRGFCTQVCERYCPDHPEQPATFCAPNPLNEDEGICLRRTADWSPDCRDLDHFQPALVSRFGEPSTVATACVPGGRGWIGDRCFTDADCMAGNTCDAAEGDWGTCTQPCERYCPDLPGAAPTLCVSGPDGQGQCARTCEAADHGAECSAGLTCVNGARNGEAAPVRQVCR